MAEEVNVGLPQNLDVDSKYTIRVTALDASGAVVAGVKVDKVVITGDLSGSPLIDDGGFVSGDWQLVPGPGA